MSYHELHAGSSAGHAGPMNPSVAMISGSPVPPLDTIPAPVKSIKNITKLYDNPDEMFRDCGFFFPLDELGKGSYGSVVKGCRTEDREKAKNRIERRKLTFYAVKQCLTGKRLSGASQLKHIDMEVKVLTALKGHPNIIRLVSHFASPYVDGYKAGTFMFFVLELASYGNIADEVLAHVQNGQVALPVPKCRFYFRQIVDGMNFMHSRGFTHRDLKLENILLLNDPDGDHKICKITDFGLSNIAWTMQDGINLMDSPAGTRRYLAPEYAYHIYMNPARDPEVLLTPSMPPSAERKGTDHMAKMRALKFDEREEYVKTKLAEMLRDREKVKLYREYSRPMRVNPMPADVWTMGVALFAMVTGKYPFITDNYPVGIDLLMAGKFIKYKNIPPDVYDLLKELFDADPAKRVNLRNLVYHKWVNIKHPDYPNTVTLRRRAWSQHADKPATPPLDPQPGPSGLQATPPLPPKAPSKERTPSRAKSGEQVAAPTRTPSGEKKQADAGVGVSTVNPEADPGRARARTPSPTPKP